MTIWTPEDKALLIQLYEVKLLPVSVIAERLGRTKSQINNMIAQETRNGNIHRLGSRMRWASRAKRWSSAALFNSMPSQECETYMDGDNIITRLPAGYARGIWPQKGIVQSDGGL